MKKTIEKLLSFLVVCAMLLSMIPTAFAAESTEPTDFAQFISPAKRGAGTYRKITQYSELTDGTYLLLAESTGTYSKNACYVVQGVQASGYVALESVKPGFTTFPDGITLSEGGESLAFGLTVSEGIVTIQNYNGDYLIDTSDSDGVGLEMKDGLCTWEFTLYDDNTWTLCSNLGNMLSLRDDLDITGSSGNPVVCVSPQNSSGIVGSYYFYLYRKLDLTTCPHSFTYTSNEDGTHEVGCSHLCGYGETEDCTISGGTCSYCGYEEAIEYTIDFIVPDGVTAPESITGSEVTLPTPSGTPSFNYNNAKFVGWTDEPVDNSTDAPNIFDANSVYTLDDNITLYALYSYSDGNVFHLFDGSEKLAVGDQIVIVARDYEFAISCTQNNNNRSAAEITKGNGTVSVDPNANVAVFSVGYGVDSSNANQYSLHDGNGYLTATSSSSNQLKTTDSITANSTWSYTVTSDGTVTLTAQGEHTRNTIRYNTSGLFSCYAATNTNLKDIQIYILSDDATTIYTTVFAEQAECEHEDYVYESNNDGTHEVICANDCGYSFTEDCLMSGGVCALCDYEEISEFTVEFIVPDGVNAVEPITGSEVVFPTPSGTPDNNVNNATFVGWTTAPVDNSTVAPVIYNTSELYTLDEDMTLYALYTYGGDMVFSLYDGSTALSNGDQVIIVAADYEKAISTTQSTNNRTAIDIVKDGDTIAVAETDAVAVFTVGKGMGNGQISLRDKNGYLTSASSSSNHLKTSPDLTENSSWTYAVESGTNHVTLTAQGTYTRNTIRYNTSSLFACYAADNANLKNIQLYILSSSGGGVYTTVFNTSEEEDCLHAFEYVSNGDGTHSGTCIDCGATDAEDCDLTNGACPICGYSVSSKYTVTFVVPDGVSAIAPISASELTFPVPSGTPNYNYNNATFVGWVTSTVANSSTAPNYYDTVTSYTLTNNLTVYALYRYGNGDVTFKPYDGSSSLKSGTQAIIAAVEYDYAIGTTQNTNNRAAVEIVRNADGSITLDANSNVAIFTLGAGVVENTIYFKDSQGYLRAASSSANNLKTNGNLDENSSWSYTYDSLEGTTKLTAQGNYTRNTIKYNKSSTLFSCYAEDNTNQFAVQLYISESAGSFVYTTVFDATCPHSDVTTDTIGASCTTAGSVTVTCNICGQIVSTNTVAALGHSYDTMEQAPNCKEDGYIIYTCVNCGDVYSEVLPSNGHNYEIVTNTSATCTTDGLIVYACSGCGDSYSEPKPASGHAYNSVVTSVLSCTTDGVTTYTCSACGNSYNDVVPATGHAYNSVVTTQPSCTTDGVTTFTCKNCGDSYEQTQAASGHSYDNGVVITMATCTTSGLSAYTCGNCGTNYTTVIEPTGHNYIVTVHPVTCLTGGYTSHLCSACGDSYITDEVAAAGHAYDIMMVDPTCVAEGYTSYVCPDCGDSYTMNPVAALGHKYTAQTTNATCTQPGQTTYTCDRCGDQYSETIPVTAHNIIFVPKVPATCYAEGAVEHYTCASCGKLYIDPNGLYEVPESYLPIPATGHTIVYVEKANATCSDNGHVAHYTCYGCGKMYIDAEGTYEVPEEYVLIPSTGHSYQTTVIAVTCTTDGYTLSVCATCGDRKITDTVTASGHNYSYIDNGETHSLACSNCGDSVTQKHTWDDGVALDQGVCTGYSNKLYTCAICNTTKIEKIGEPNHALTFYPETYATCDTEGYTEHYACNQCGKYFVDAACNFELPESYVKSPALGHTYTYTNQGKNHVVGCAHCNYSAIEAHSFTNGTCVCGANQSTAPVYNEKLVLTMSISVGAEMQVKYTIQNAKVKDYASFYIEVVKDVVGGESVSTTFSLAENNLEAMSRNGVLLGYNATYTGIFASMMGDDFTATLYAVTNEGVVHYGPSVTSSIKKFLLEQINSTTSSAELKTLAVDMLNYGAAAQTYFEYNAENPVNADLTAAQLALGTQSIPNATNSIMTSGTGGNISADVSLKSKVILFVTSRYASNENSNLKFVIKDSKGNILDEFAPTLVTKVACQGSYTNVGASQMRQLLTIELYDNDVLVSKSLTWSVESYVANTRANSASTSALINAVNAMLIYGDSAAAYLTSSGQ